MQQQPQHTAGPWKATQLLHSKDARRWVILAADASSAGTHHRRLDAAGCFTEADARLIAEASALLAELQAVLESLKTGVPETIGYGALRYPAFEHGWKAALDMVYARAEQARAVIARATGQEC